MEEESVSILLIIYSDNLLFAKLFETYHNLECFYYFCYFLILLCFFYVLILY